MKSPRWLLIVVVAASGCGKGPTSPSPALSAPAKTYTSTTLSFTSDPSDFVGAGRSMSFTLQDSVFAANVNNDGGYLSIVIRPKNAPTPTSWGLVVMAPAGVRIAPGTYATVRDFGSRWTADFGGDGRGCGRLTGTMTVHSFDFSAENSAIRNFRASFEQHCEGATAALRGEVAILADPWR